MKRKNNTTDINDTQEQKCLSLSADSNEIIRNARNIIESYIFATGRRDLTVFSERLLIILADTAQNFNGSMTNENRQIRNIKFSNLGEVQVDIPLKEIVAGKSSNYYHARKSIKELLDKHIIHQYPATKNGQPVLDKNGKQMYVLQGHQIINNIDMNKKPGIVSVTVNRITWQALLDMSKGYRKYDITTALILSKSSAIRMLKIISNQNQPFLLSIQSLREQWELVDKYPRMKDFLKFTMETAKRELDEKSFWTFDYKPVNKDATPGNRTPTHILIIPKKNENLVTKTDIKLSNEAYETLMIQFNMSPKLIMEYADSLTEAESAGELNGLLKKFHYLYNLGTLSQKEILELIKRTYKGKQKDLDIPTKSDMPHTLFDNEIEEQSTETETTEELSELKKLLTEKYGFTKQELERNKDVINNAELNYGAETLSKNQQNIENSSNKKGYIITILKATSFIPQQSTRPQRVSRLRVCSADKFSNENPSIKTPEEL